MKKCISGFLLLAGLTTVTFSEPYKIIEKENVVCAQSDGQTLWIYHHDPAEGKPYFHPLSATDGTLFTDLRPEDHPWHRGVWFSWKFINGVNYWEEDRKTGRSAGETRIVQVRRQVSDLQVAQFTLNIDYAPAQSKVIVLKEERCVTVHPPDRVGTYRVDLSTRFQAQDTDVLLARTPPPNEPNGEPWGGYAGWSVRMHKGVMDGIFLNSHGVEGADRQSAAWMLFKAPQGGSLLFMDQPQNLNYPATWYLAQNMPYFSPAVIHDAPYTIKVGQSLHLRYRLVVAPDPLDHDRAREAWNAWTGATSSKQGR